jgi:SPP1 gp7 family putative phage head morphogenesis protein
MRKRFRALRGVIRKALVEDDVFNLINRPTTQAEMTSPGAKAFDFPRSKDKVEEFMNWLNGEIERGVIETRDAIQSGTAIEEAWTDKYIKDSYQRGVQRARYEMKQVGYEVSSLGNVGGGGIEAVMSQPFHVDTVGVLYTRVFNELKGITEAMSQQISRVLSQGIIDGDNPRLLARKLNAVIKGGGADLGITDTLGRYIPAQRRAEILARTEVIRAHHQATMQEYRNAGAEGVKVKAEWQTAGDNRVCPRCSSLQGQVFTLDEMQNKIPLHPQCRCVALPTEPNIEKKKMPRSGRKSAPKPKPKPETTPTPSPRGTRNDYWSEDITESEYKNYAYHAAELNKKFDNLGFKINADGSMSSKSAVKKINFAGAHLSDLQARFPKVREYVEKLKSRGKNPRIRMENTKFIDNAGGLGGYTPNKDLITLGTKASNKYADSLSFGKFNVSPDFGGALRHEIGHSINMPQGIMSVSDSLDFNKLYTKLGHNYIKRNIGEYAASNKKEFFAECFSAYTSSLYGTSAGKRLPKEVHDLFEKVLGKPEN